MEIFENYYNREIQELSIVLINFPIKTALM